MDGKREHAELVLRRVQTYTFGYDHQMEFHPRVSSAFGGQYMFHAKPAFFDSVYGDHPDGRTFLLPLPRNSP